MCVFGGGLPTHCRMWNFGNITYLWVQKDIHLVIVAHSHKRLISHLFIKINEGNITHGKFPSTNWEMFTT